MDQARHIAVPHYSNLTVPLILDYLVQFEDLGNYLPSSRLEIQKLPRQYICNLAATVVGEPFYEFVKQSVK